MNNYASPIKTVKARVVGKSTYIYSKDRSLHSVYIVQTDYVAFELEDLKRIVIEVSPYVFTSLIEDDKGVLSYREQGSNLFFVDFERQ